MKETYRTPLAFRQDSIKRRDELRDAGVCINGPKVGSVGLRGIVHGPVVKNSGGKCQRCLDVKKGVKS